MKDDLSNVSLVNNASQFQKKWRALSPYLTYLPNMSLHTQRNFKTFIISFVNPYFSHPNATSRHQLVFTNSSQTSTAVSFNSNPTYRQMFTEIQLKSRILAILPLR